jgi:hypothetical protein
VLLLGCSCGDQHAHLCRQQRSLRKRKLATWRSEPCSKRAGLVREVRGGDPAGAVEHALGGLDRGAWGAGPHSPLAATLRLPVDELLHCRSVRR